MNGVVGAIIWITARVGTHSGVKDHTFALYAFEAFDAAFLMVCAACCFRRYLDPSVCGSNRLALSLGCLMGALILTSPTAAVIFIGWLAWLAWRDRVALLGRGSHLVLILVPTAIVAPWLLRNYKVFDRFILVRDNFGLELAVSNSDGAMFGLQQNNDSGHLGEVHPFQSMSEARKVLTYGEAKYNEVRLREALDWIKTHPRRFLKLCAVRCVAFWIPPAIARSYTIIGPGRILERIAIYAMTLLSVVGLWILYQRDRKSAVVCITCLALFPLVHYVVQSSFRYRFPILWVTFLLGAVPISSCGQYLYRAVDITSWVQRGQLNAEKAARERCKKNSNDICRNNCGAGSQRIMALQDSLPQ